MWIRFKFRSAVNFDVVEIGDRPAISVGELKSKIVAMKNIRFFDDFDLVFSDHLSGQEYNDENYQIPSNSSVIIKRVPAGSVPPALPFNSTDNLVLKKPDLFQEKGRKMDDFNDFGIDLCPVPEKILPYSHLESKQKNICDSGKANIVGSRLGGQKLQANDLVEVIPKGSDHYNSKGKFPPENLEPKVQEHVKLGKKAIEPYDLAEKNAILPAELRCPICMKFLKKAVMIPCCQHSFCEICIRGVLNEKSKCPKCFSDKFKAEHLLPNLSLRQAIEHFLDTQIDSSISETVLRRYVPDEESCVQANNICTAPISQKWQNEDPSATKKGSNLLGEFLHGESLIKRYYSSKTGYHPSFSDCQGENYPLNFPQYHAHEKGEDRKVSATAMYRKVDRTCYMCDAPDHFIRDCPFAKGPHPFVQTVGARPTFATTYWNNTAFGLMWPFTNIYENHGMMPYNASMFPVSPVGVSPYMASMYSHIPAHGNPRMAVMAPLAGHITEKTFTHDDVLKTQDFKIRGRHSKEYMMRRQPNDGDVDDDIQSDRHNLPKSSRVYLFHAERENGGSYSGEEHTRRPQGNLRAADFDRDSHFLHDRYGKKRNHHERRGHFGSDSNRKERHGQKDKRKVYSDERVFRKKHGSRFGSGEERSFSGDQKRGRREGDHRSSKRTSDGTKYIQNELFCRSKMIRRDEDFADDNYQSKGREFTKRKR